MNGITPAQDAHDEMPNGPSTVGCPKGCYDMDWCLASLVVPCALPKLPPPDPSGQFNPACGCLLRSLCRGCGVCKSCDGCYCGED